MTQKLVHVQTTLSLAEFRSLVKVARAWGLPRTAIMRIAINAFVAQDLGHNLEERDAKTEAGIR